MDWRVTPVDGVEVVYEWEAWRIWAKWPTRARNDISTQIRIDYTGPNPQLVRSTRRLNLLSDSGLDKVALSMRRHAKTEGIDAFINAVAEDLISWYRKGLATVYPQPEQRNGAGWLVYPIWPKLRLTAVAAAGGSFKSFIAQALALQLATGEEILAGNTRTPVGTTRVLFLDWEADQETFAERLYGLQRGADLPTEPVLAYKQMRVPLVDAAGGLADEIGRGRFGAVVVDSMSAGIGGDLVDAAVVNAFWDAASLLGVPVLVLAHKSAENVQKRQKRFFGSIMSENRIRLAWNAERAADGRSVLWESFKDNNGLMPHLGYKLAWNLDFRESGDEMERRLESLTLKGVNPHNVQLAANEGATRSDQIHYALLEAGKALLPNELAAVADVPASTVRVELKRGLEAGLFDKTPDGRYRISENPDPW